MNMTKQELEALLKEACLNTGHVGEVSMPTKVALEFARLISNRCSSDLRDAALILSPGLQLAISMGSIDGAPSMVGDIKRGYELMAKAL